MSKWEDTVMSDKKIEEISFSRVMGRYKQVAEAQAEISFTKGYIQGYEDSAEKHRRVGIKEVVDYLEREGAWLYRIMGMMSQEQKETLEAQLKKWGIK